MHLTRRALPQPLTSLFLQWTAPLSNFTSLSNSGSHNVNTTLYRRPPRASLTIINKKTHPATIMATPPPAPAAKPLLLLVFIHGFKGTDHTFHHFPRDLQHALAAQLPGLDILTLLFPQYETRGDLRDCVARFKEWLQNKVIDLEVANATPSPTVDPSVHVVLKCLRHGLQKA